jgi:hypothetical protein
MQGSVGLDLNRASFNWSNSERKTDLVIAFEEEDCRYSASNAECVTAFAP